MPCSIEKAANWELGFFEDILRDARNCHETGEDTVVFHYTSLKFASLILEQGLKPSETGRAKGWFFSKLTPIDVKNQSFLGRLGLKQCQLWKVFYADFVKTQLSANYGQDMEGREENCEVCLAFKLPKRCLRSVEHRREAVYIRLDDSVCNGDVLSAQRIIRAFLLNPDMDASRGGRAEKQFEEGEEALYTRVPEKAAEKVVILNRNTDGTYNIASECGIVNFPDVPAEKLDKISSEGGCSGSFAWMFDHVGFSLKPKFGGFNVRVAEVCSGAEIILFYFSAFWCPPCRAFTPVLKQRYQEALQQGIKVVVIFVSADQNEEQFMAYFTGQGLQNMGGDVAKLMDGMPWHAIPYSDSQRRAQLGRKFDVEGYPHLVALDAAGKEIEVGVQDLHRKSIRQCLEDIGLREPVRRQIPPQISRDANRARAAVKEVLMRIERGIGVTSDQVEDVLAFAKQHLRQEDPDYSRLHEILLESRERQAQKKKESAEQNLGRAIDELPWSNIIRALTHAREVGLTASESDRMSVLEELQRMRSTRRRIEGAYGAVDPFPESIMAALLGARRL